MPTGYTAAIKNGIDFRTYALDCARAFGACVMLRDEPGGGERIPEVFEPNDYHLKWMEEACIELARLDAMTPGDIDRASSLAWDDAEARRLAGLEEIRELRKKYDAILAEAVAWEAPTPEHEELRTFMIQQIVNSIEFDCDERFYDAPPSRPTGESWAAERREALTRTIDYQERQHAQEVARAATRTEWVRALRASLTKKVST